MSRKKIIFLLIVVISSSGFAKPDEITLGQAAVNGYMSIFSIAHLTLLIFAIGGLYMMYKALISLLFKGTNDSAKTSGAVWKLFIGSMLFAIPALIITVNVTADLDPTKQIDKVILSSTQVTKGGGVWII